MAAVSHWRVGIYAEDGGETFKLRQYARQRGWAVEAAYRPSQWDELIADARAGKFQYICASFEGLWWTTRLDSSGDLLPLVPQPAPSPKGGLKVPVDQIESFLVAQLANGPLAKSAMAELLLQSDLAWGTARSVVQAIGWTLRRSKAIAHSRNEDTWRLVPSPRKKAKP
jgi:hypothetical protein